MSRYKKLLLARSSLVSAMIVLTLFLIFFWVSNLIQLSNQQWYSSSLVYRYQTDAILEGRLSLHENPKAIEHDWGFESGAQQLWGLGVPVLRLPFEMIARVFGYSAFPDRIVFDLLVWVTLLFLWNGLKAQEELRKENQIIEILNSIVRVSILLFFPPIMNLISARFWMYEEAVICGCLWSFILWGSLQVFLKNSKISYFIAICLMSGFAAHIRLTLIYAGVVTYLLLNVLAIQKKFPKKLLIFGIFIFSVGPILVLVTNHLRFGGPFEFGYKVNQSGNPLNDYSLRFSYPFAHVPFREAVIELFGTLFGNVKLFPAYFKGLNQNSFSSTTLRYREQYSETYNWWILFSILMGWITGVVSWFRLRREKWTSFSESDLSILVSGLWSVSIFILLAQFYLYSPSLTSRYLIDFAPCIAIAVCMGVSFIQKYLLHSLSPSLGRISIIGLNLFLGGWLILGILFSKGQYFAQREAYRLEELQDALKRKNVGDLPNLPSRYTCEDGNRRYGILYNGEGWSRPGSCLVSELTQVFLPNVPCVELTVRRAIGPTSSSEHPYSYSDVNAKLGSHFLTFLGQIEKDSSTILTFCDQNLTDRVKAQPYRVLSIAWVPVRDLDKGYPPVQLLSIEGKSEDKSAPFQDK